MKNNKNISDKWLEKLHKSRSEDLVVFKKPQYINVFNGVIDKYSDSAHFIYELLQNADDAKATEVKMVLMKDKFIFSHNGTVKFTVSNPETEPEDRAKNTLGHINSITAIGFSSKTKSFEEKSREIKIGKFGVGFKAIFQYTTTPYIYDSDVCFKIEDYIVPTKVNYSSYCQKGKTVFVIPFDRDDISPEQAYEDIENKIASLTHPQLFLFHVQKVSWETERIHGKIIKKVVARYKSNKDINSVLYQLKSNSADNTRILLFSRDVEVPSSDRKHTIAIGYFIKDRWRIDTEIRPNLNCFFPTQENIGTCYVVHAPFALVDSRQQIKKNNDINTSLFRSIGQLAADSIVELRDISLQSGHHLLNDNILELMKFNLNSVQDNYKFTWYQKETITFKDYYDKIIDNEDVFLSKNKTYISKQNGWWADSDMQRLISSEQLDLLTKIGLSDGKIENITDQELTYDFILCSLIRKDKEAMAAYDVDEFTDDRLSRYLGTPFLNRQEESWLERLYDYILNKRLLEIYRLNNGNMSKGVMRQAKIIKTESEIFVAPFQENKLNVFFNSDSNRTINSKLYSSCVSFNKLIKEIGVKAPDLIDEIRIQIDKQSDLDRIANNTLLTTIINYYYSASLENRQDLMTLVLKKFLFRCRNILTPDEDNLEWKCTADICTNNELLFVYYELAGLTNKYFIYNEYYQSTIKSVGLDRFNDFLGQMNFSVYPCIITREYPLIHEELIDRPNHCYTSNKKVQVLEGLEEVLFSLHKCKCAKKMSHYIWDVLVHYVTMFAHLQRKLFINDQSEYKYYQKKIHEWPTCTMRRWLHNMSWLYIGNNLKSILNGVYQQDLEAEAYTYNSDLFKELSIDSTPNIAERESIQQMSDETKEVFALGDTVKQLGITSLDELTELIARGRASKQKDNIVKVIEDQRKYSDDFVPQRKKSKKLSESDFKTPTPSVNIKKEKTSTNEFNLEEALAGFEEKVNIQKEELEHVLSLRSTVETSSRYSLRWFQALMELELQSQGTTSKSGKRSICILFDKVYINDGRIVLKGATKSLPPLLEDMDGIPVVFHLHNGEKQNILFDNASIIEDSLILRNCAAAQPLVDTLAKNIKLISYATIDAEKPIELIKQWRSLILHLPLENDVDSVKDNLRSDLKFIFGPPGTGKTTTLAHRISSIFKERKEAKILVLAPTNKACDVLAQKILTLYAYPPSWLCRFVSTQNEELEHNGIVHKRDSDIVHQDQVCVISTIARYAFDGFEDGLLRTSEWDLIVIDEASMIPLYQIIPILYNKRNKLIWIAGDPFQIDPIVNIDTWKYENIYKMVGLEDFGNPITTPHQFDVELLMKQYRSIPVIGEVYSQYMYAGKLEHDRSAESHRFLKMGLKESPLNIISFPVTKNSIFETKKLMGSNIHVYSVVFAVEFIKYITQNISTSHPGENVKIGILSPYGIEIQSIMKLYNQTCIPYPNISITFGTSHGFQGDQCDIIVAVMNPPASGMIRTPDLTFINKPNILNVAISRAKDYLFLLIPGKEYDKFDNLFEIKKVGKIMTSTKSSAVYTADDIEKLMFGSLHYIENNTYITAHQSTNIYSDPLAKYEVRMDDNAIDIQVNNIVKS